MNLASGTYIYGLPTGTIDNLQAVIPMDVGMPSNPRTIRSSLAQLASQAMATQFQPSGTLVLNQGYIAENSAKLTYITGTSYRVETGSAEVNGTRLTWSSPITRSGLSFTSGTMNYVYLYSSGGSAAVEESTTVPVWDSTLNYWKKTGDASRRCIGFLQASTVNTIRQFVSIPNGRNLDFLYTEDSESARSLVLGQTASVWTSIDLSKFVPLNASHWYVLTKLALATAGDEGTVGLSPVSLPNTAANLAPHQVRGRAAANGANIFFGTVLMPIVETQTFYWRTIQNNGSPTCSIIVCGSRMIR